MLRLCVGEMSNVICRMQSDGTNEFAARRKTGRNFVRRAEIQFHCDSSLNAPTFAFTFVFAFLHPTVVNLL